MSNTDAQSKEAQAAHRDQALEHVDRVRQMGSFDEEALTEAVRRLTQRMDDGEWYDGKYLLDTNRKVRDMPSEGSPPPQLACDIAELAVVHLLSRTGSHGQFSVTPNGYVFAGKYHG